jgi:hypothetical protein
MKMKTIGKIASIAGLSLLLGCGKAKEQTPTVKEWPKVVPAGFVAPLGFDAYRISPMPPEGIHCNLAIAGVERGDRIYLFLGKTDENKQVVDIDHSFENAVLFNDAVVNHLIGERLKSATRVRASKGGSFIDFEETLSVNYDPAKIVDGCWNDYVEVSISSPSSSERRTVEYFGSPTLGSKGLVNCVKLRGKGIDLELQKNEILQRRVTEERNNLIHLLVRANRNTYSSRKY